MEANVTVTFANLTPAEARNLFASIQYDYQGPKPVVAAGCAVPTTTPPAPTTKEAGQSLNADVAQQAPGDTAAIPPQKKAPKPRQGKKGGTTEEAPSIDDVRKVLADLLAEQGADACRELLAKFDADRVTKLDEAKYGEFVAAAKELAV